ncbi:MAG: NAD-dependent epimerase/dehydratase family protein [Kiritimatiellae bacterium]|nr:NAD-dependent epimerase/dehydratase family protein [Kiritimatiellia bacterium]
MSTVLVTGGAGFIGSHVVDALLEDGHRVVALDDLSGGCAENVTSPAVLVKGTILDTALLNTLFNEHRFDYVFHLAAYAAEGLSHFIRQFNYANNLIGSVNLINAAVNAKSVKCFVFTSSIAVYGANQVPMSEEMVPTPEDPYGIAKYAVEMDLKAAHEIFGLNYVIFRPHNVYGERQNIGDPYRNVIGIFMNQILKGEPLTVFGDGSQTRAFTHISDVAPIIAKSVEREAAYGQTFNVGAEKPYSVNDLARTVADVMGVPTKIRHLPPRNEVVHAFSSHEKVRSFFGELIQNVPLKRGLERMASWVRQAGARQGKPFTTIEIRHNMPPSWARLTDAS